MISPEVFSQYVGETEKLIRYIFKRAKQLSPCVLVFDEIDALAPMRELQNNATVTDSGSSARALSQLLNEMDGISNRKQVFIVGCTNRIELIDQAILRPGRLDQILYMHMPEEEDLVEIFKVYKGKFLNCFLQVAQYLLTQQKCRFHLISTLSIWFH